jgi:hypothetical protein
MLVFTNHGEWDSSHFGFPLILEEAQDYSFLNIIDHFDFTLTEIDFAFLNLLFELK